MRKLAISSLAFSAAVFAANYIVGPDLLLPLSAISLFTGAVMIFLRRRWLIPVTLCFLFFSFGLSCYSSHSSLTAEKAKAYSGYEYVTDAVILDYPDVYEDYCRLEVRIQSEDLPDFKALLYDNEKVLAHAKPGDLLHVRTEIKTADTLYGEQYGNYHSKGIYFKLYPKSEMILEEGEQSLAFLPKYVSHWLCERIDKVFPEDTEVFMRALMLGDKADLYMDDGLYVSMSRAGLMHIVAVSGLHVSFLVMLLHTLLGRGRKSALLCLVLLWFFALVVGAGPSVVRAGFMQSTYLMAPVLKRENDPLTSLSAILAICLLINPFAAASISLQLSFAAIAGLMIFHEKIYGYILGRTGGGARTGIIASFCSALASSLSVLVFTIPLTAIHFGYVSLLSPLSNLLSLWAVSYCFCLGWISCALSFIPVAGDICAWLCSWLARYIMFIAECVSSVPFSVMYTCMKGSWLWMGITYSAMILLVFKRGALLSFIVPGCISAILLTALMYGNRMHYRENPYFTVLDVGQGQSVCALSQDSVVVVDCGNVSELDDAGMITASYLYSCGRDRIDCLVLTSLREEHADGVAMLMEMMDLEHIILPDDPGDNPCLYDEICMCAKKHGVKISSASQVRSSEYGDIALETICSYNNREELLSDKSKGTIAKLSIGKRSMLVMGDASAYAEKIFLRTSDLEKPDVLVVSRHGSEYASSSELLTRAGGETAVISVGYNNFDQPSDEVLEALDAYGYNIYRTDTDGTIEIQAG